MSDTLRDDAAAIAAASVPNEAACTCEECARRERGEPIHVCVCKFHKPFCDCALPAVQAGRAC